MRASILQTLLVVAGFDFVWLTTAAGAGTDWGSWIGWGASVLYITASAFAGLIKLEAVAPILAWSIVGFGVEVILAAAGLTTYGTHSAVFFGIPFWIVSLWAAFGSMFIALWPAVAPPVSVLVVSAMGAPLAYIAGSRLGALELVPMSSGRWVLISFTYLVALFALTRFIHTTVSSFFSSRSSRLKS